jgi:prefoldin beta subunit
LPREQVPAELPLPFQALTHQDLTVALQICQSLLPALLDPRAMEQDRSRLQTLSEALQKAQDGANPPPFLDMRSLLTSAGLDLQSAVDARQKLEAQQQENKAVQKEFASLADDAGIYRLVGPVLLKQDKTEAVGTVDGRLDFIGKEIGRTETRIKELQDSNERKRVELLQLQQKMQLAAQEQGAG